MEMNPATKVGTVAKEIFCTGWIHTMKNESSALEGSTVPIEAVINPTMSFSVTTECHLNNHISKL